MNVCAACGHEASEPFRFCPECGAPAETKAPQQERRKVVTVLFCDVVDSTTLGGRLDPEALRTLLARYFDRMKAIVEAHGGTVEKFIGDAVMAVFGVPAVHEDDALRAVRAAVEMRAALPELGVEGRIGITTGEVVTGTEERLATGDPVNVAARLEQAAAAGEILIGAATMALVRGAVEAEPVEPLVLKGKPEAIGAFRVLALGAEPTRRHSAPMVGRARPLRQLAEAFASLENGRCHLFTVLGAAGVGKSRLVTEFLATIDATVARGRCLPYGEGITYWPVVEVLKQLDARPAEAAAAAAIASLLGETATAAASDEIAWAVRRTLEQAAGDEPLVVVLDDIQWGEPAFLDLIEHVADLSRDAPILLVCMARPELLDRRSGWAGGKHNATTILLDPLSPEEADALIDEIATLDDALRARVRETAAGNPLFLEEMVAVVRDAGAAALAVPPSIQALLAARLDQLAPPERAVLERAAVEGEVFHRRAVEALLDGAPGVGSLLTALVRKELVRPDRSLSPGDEAFRFHHLLIRDAAYEGLPKALRAELHGRFAAWLESGGPSLVEEDELVGYHLEQACLYRAELGRAPDPPVAAAARRRLAAAGRRAFQREDPAAATNLIGRAVSLLPGGEVELELELDLVFAVEYTADIEGAARSARTLAGRAARAGDRAGELCALILERMYLLALDPEGSTDRLEALVDEAMPVFEAANNDLALWVGYYARGEIAKNRLQMAAMLDAHERGLACAQRLGLARQELIDYGHITAAYRMGPTPIAELLVWIETLEAKGLRQSWITDCRAWAVAMTGRLDEGRAIMAALRAELAERGAALALARRLEASYDLEMLAEDYASAERIARQHAQFLEERGERASLSTVMSRLGRAVYELGRYDEAEAAAARAAALGASDDVFTQVEWRQVKSKVLARRGAHEDAERLAREAVALAFTTDVPHLQGYATLDLAEVLRLGGKAAESAEALENAAGLFDRKGNVVAAERARARLAAPAGP